MTSGFHGCVTTLVENLAVVTNCESVSMTQQTTSRRDFLKVGGALSSVMFLGGYSAVVFADAAVADAATPAAAVDAVKSSLLNFTKDLQSRYPVIGDVDGLGLALRAEICKPDGFTPDKELLDRMVEEGIKGDLEVDGKKYGLVLDVGGYYKNVITLAPSLEISYPEIDLGLKLLEQLLVRATTR